MIRSKVWWFVAAVLALFSLGSVAPGPRDVARAQRLPNILIILTDDQRGGMQVLPQTRSFFGIEGTRFSHGFTNTPLCCPARATLMTGQYPHNHGVIGNSDWPSLNQENTLQHDLQAAGYKTALFGKYLNHFPVETQAPPGFDRFAVFHTGGKGSGYYRGGTWNVDGTVKTIDRYASRVLQNKGARFIRESGDQPWLMILSLPAPHSPYTAQRKYASAPVKPWGGNPAVWETDRSDKPEWITRFEWDLNKGRSLRRQQLRALMSVDDVVGTVASALREAEQADDTLAFFTTDNGYLWGEHGMLGKPSPYMQSIQVPFYARWPGRFGAGEVADHLVSHIDITATAYEAAGVTPDHELDGYSLLGPHRRERLLTEMMHTAKGVPVWTSLVTATGDHYVEYLSGEEVLYRELYELVTDPWELENVAAARPEKLGQLAPLLTVDRRCSGATCP